MRPFIFLSVVAVSGFLGGCAQTIYTKQGSTQAEALNAREVCVHRGYQARLAVLQSTTYRSPEAQRDAANIAGKRAFEKCLEERGYRKQS